MRHAELYDVFILDPIMYWVQLCACLHVCVFWGILQHLAQMRLLCTTKLDPLMLHKQVIDPVSAQLSLDFAIDLCVDHLHPLDSAIDVAERPCLLVSSAIELDPVSSPPQSLSLCLVRSSLQSL